MSEYLVQIQEGTTVRTVPLDAETGTQARQICRHHHPGCVIVSVQASGARAPIKPPRAPAAKPVVPPAGGGERINVEVWRNLRKYLATIPEPASTPAMKPRREPRAPRPPFVPVDDIPAAAVETLRGCIARNAAALVRVTDERARAQLSAAVQRDVGALRMLRELPAGAWAHFGEAPAAPADEQPSLDL